MIKKLVIIIALAILIASVAGCTSSPTSSPTNSTTSSITSTPTSSPTSTPTSTTPSTQTGVELSAYRNGTAPSDFGTLYQITVKLTNNGPGNFDYEKDITFYTSGQQVNPILTHETSTWKSTYSKAQEYQMPGASSSSWRPGTTGMISFGFESNPTMLTYNDGNSTKTVQL